MTLALTTLLALLSEEDSLPHYHLEKGPGLCGFFTSSNSIAISLSNAVNYLISHGPPMHGKVKTGSQNGTKKPDIEINLCDSDRLMTFLTSLQIVDPENIVRLSYHGDLNPFCKRVGKGLEDAYGYMKTCYVTPQQRLYTNLIAGINSLYQTLCLNIKYRHSFERHSDCFRKLYNEVDNCDGPKDWAEDTNRTRLCKAYENIVDCYMIKTALICGPEAADVFKKLLINVLRATVVTDCGLRSHFTMDQRIEKPFMTQKIFNILYLVIIFILIISLVLVYKKEK